MKKLFTLIELITVIVVIGMLAAIVIPNTRDTKDTAFLTAVNSNIHNLQKGVDVFKLKHFDSLPVKNTPTILKPEKLDFSQLNPKYVRSNPKDNLFYWVDYNGVVWASSVDSPIVKIDKGAGTNLNITWDSNSKAKKYIVYEIENYSELSGEANKPPTFKQVGVTTNNSYTVSSSHTHFLVSAIDKWELQTPPAGEGYQGYDEFVINQRNRPPVAKITMNPSSFVTTDMVISWSSNLSSDPDGDNIVDSEWIGKQSTYPTVGTYTVKLRVKDSKGAWSEWEDITFNVIKANGIKDLQSGYWSNILLMNNGTLKGAGYNQYKQLGDLYGTEVRTFSTIPNVSNVTQVSIKNQHTLALINDGTVIAFGNNGAGQVRGDSRTTSGYGPYTIPNLNNVMQVSAGSVHSMALLKDGKVAVWGDNSNGLLGLGDTSQRYTFFSIIPNLSGVRKVSAGSTHSLLLMEDGTIKSFGDNYYGQLGIGSTISQSKPISIPSLTNVVDVFAGFGTSFAITSDGSLYAWGKGDRGILGYYTYSESKPKKVTGISSVKSVSSNQYHTLVMTSDKVYSFGNNDQWAVGTNNSQEYSPFELTTIKNAKFIGAGYWHSYAITSSDDSYIWGRNDYGLSGNGDYTLGYKYPLFIDLPN